MYSITKQWNVINSGSDHTLNRGSVIATQSPGGGPQGLSLTSFRSLLTPPGCSGVTLKGVLYHHPSHSHFFRIGDIRNLEVVGWI